MIKTKKILGLILSCLLIISALPLTVGAAEEVIKWKGGYDTGSAGNSGTIYDGYADMPYTVFLNEGGTGDWYHIGNDWGAAMELAPNNHKLSFELTPSYTGEYKLEVEVSSAGDILHSYVNDIEIGTTEATGGFFGFSGMQDAGTVVLEAGVPVKIAFSNRNDSGAGNGIALRDCVLTFVRETEPPKEETIHWQAGWDANNNPDDIHYDIGGQDINWIGADYGTILDIVQLDRMIKYAITPKYTGYYTLYMTMGTHGLTTIDIHVDGQKADEFSFSTTNWDTRQKFEVANIFVVENTEFNLGVTMKSGAFGATDCELVYVPEPKIEASSVENDDVVTRSTDVITLDFSRELDENKLDDAVVSIEDSLSNKLEYALELDEADASKVNIILSETLKYDESYTFTHMAFTDSVGYSTEEVSVNFVTASKEDDDSADNSTVNIDADVENTTFTVTGALYGSKGQGIAGREVTVSMTSPLGNDTKVIDTVTTGDNGEFTLTYTLAQEEEENGGIYTFSAAAEHAALYDKDTVRYLSAGQKFELLGALEGYTTSAEVKSFFGTDTNAADMGVNTASLSELTDDSLFYDRLAKASYKNGNGDYDIKVFEKVWNTSYALEMINQKDSDAVTLSYLENADFAEAISLNNDKYALLSEQKSAFVSAVTALERQENAEAFGTEVAKLLNDKLLIENDKTDLALTLSDVSVYTGQTAEVALALTDKTADICEYIVEVTCPSGGVAEDISFAKLDGTTVSKAVSGSVASFKVTNVSGELTKLGTLEYSSSSERTEELTVSGTAVYDIEGTPLTCDIAEATVDIEVKKNESKGGSDKSSTYSSSGGGNKVVIAPVTDPDEGKQEVTSPSSTFTDIADAQWAEESIISLYNKGIISEAQDGRFRPNDSVTRAEFVKMLTVALGITDKTASVALMDVSQSDWYYPYVSAAVNYGLVLGDEHGNFNPNDKITRQDICVIISRAMDKLGYGQSSGMSAMFSDDYMISDYARSAVYRMRSHEIVNGTGDGSFAPLSDATRAATAKIIDTFMKEAKI